MTLTELALRRAGAENLQDFQNREGLYPSGREDILTMQRLSPYLLGFERYMVKPGDTYYRLARTFGTSVRAILTANPNQDPNRLLAGQYLNLPYGFPVVPTDIPFTSELLQVCIQGLMARYPFLARRTIATTLYRRPVTALSIGSGPRAVLYNASHHANEWITTPVLMKFLEEYAHAVSVNGRIFGMDAQRLFQQARLYLVPMVNPDGVDLVTGAVAPGSQEAFRQGLLLPDGMKCLPAELEVLASGQVRVTVHEGKFHQVKRMLAACGAPVTYLRRLSMGPLQLDETLETGQFRPLSQEEIAALRLVTGK